MYDLMTKQGKKEDKKFVYDYLGEELSDGKSFDAKNLNKEYDPRIDQSKYQGFWEQNLNMTMDLKTGKG